MGTGASLLFYTVTLSIRYNTQVAGKLLLYGLDQIESNLEVKCTRMSSNYPIPSIHNQPSHNLILLRLSQCRVAKEQPHAISCRLFINRFVV